MKPREYEVIEAFSTPFYNVAVGQRVFGFLGCDYGCAADDTEIVGEDFKSFTHQTDGFGEFFTLPLRCVRQVGGERNPFLPKESGQ